MKVKTVKYDEQLTTRKDFDNLKQKGYKAILINSTGTDNINIPLAKKLGFKIDSIGEYCSDSTAEYAFFQLLLLTKRFVEVNKKFFAWNHATELKSKKCLVIGGEGRIGSRVARMAKGFGLNVTVYDKTLNQPKKLLKEFLTTANIIFLCTDLNKETKNFFSIKDFELMIEKPFIINPSRLGLLNLDVVQRAIARNLISGYACDELPNHSLVNNCQCFFSPHLASKTFEANARRERLIEFKKRELSGVINC